jgi:hypothetical protein
MALLAASRITSATASRAGTRWKLLRLTRRTVRPTPPARGQTITSRTADTRAASIGITIVP